MPTKKRRGGPHKAPRKPVQIRTDWLLIARKLAALERQPTNWYIIGLIEKAAKEAALDGLPTVPWEDGSTP